MGTGDRDEDEMWILDVADADPTSPRVRESILSTGNGAFGTRGTREEDGPETVPIVLANGVYQIDGDGMPTLLPAPTWVGLELPADLPPSRYRLDLRAGMVERLVDDPGGPLVRTRHFACLDHPGIMVLEADLRDGISGYKPGANQHDSTRTLSRLGGGIASETSTVVSARPDGGVHIERIAAYVSDAAERPSSSKAARDLARACRRGTEALAEVQRERWEHRWSTADVAITGRPDLTRLARFALYHLMASAPARGEAAVSARGLTGIAYLGHVFWDADVFALPFFAATHPAAARAMIRYRSHRLAAARQAARLRGRRGARFPWESAKDGRDVTPRVAIDSTGHEIPILSGVAEEHITADVAWSLWQYAAWTGDTGFVLSDGWAILVESARYWASRSGTDADGAGHLTGVVGPDEYHELVDDNAFTNVMAAWNLARATELVDTLGCPGSSLRERLAIDCPDTAEVRSWRDLSRALTTGYDERTGIYEQFSGYHKLEPLLAADFGKPPYPADLVLGPDRVARTQIIKQADALMLHFLVEEFTEPGSLVPNLDFYLPRTCHGSSLSPAVHACLLARAGRADEAEELMGIALRLDVEDLTGTTAAGVHLGTMGGVWQALVTGFAGVRPSTALGADGKWEPVLCVDPHLPESWEGMTVNLIWRGIPVNLRVAQDGSVSIATRAAITIRRADGSLCAVDPPGGPLG